MKTVVCAVLMAAGFTCAWPSYAAEQAYRARDITRHPAQAGGFSVLAALTNTVYIPVRLAVTVVTAEVGAATGWLTGGDQAAAESVWGLTEGQALISPAVLQGHETLRFGPWPSRE